MVIYQTKDGQHWKRLPYEPLNHENLFATFPIISIMSVQHVRSWYDENAGEIARNVLGVVDDATLEEMKKDWVWLTVWNTVKGYLRGDHHHIAFTNCEEPVCTAANIVALYIINIIQLRRTRNDIVKERLEVA